MHVKCERTVLKFILALILKEDVTLLTRITTFLMRLIGMSDIVQLQTVIDPTPVVWSLKSTFAWTRFFLMDQVRFWRRAHIWGFDWSCTGNIRDIKLYGLLRSDRNELCIWRRGVRRHHCGKGRELRRGRVREHLKFCNRLVCKDSNQLVRTKERK